MDKGWGLEKKINRRVTRTQCRPYLFEEIEEGRVDEFHSRIIE